MSRLKKIANDTVVPVNEDNVEQTDQQDLKQESELNVESAKMAVESINNTVTDMVDLYKQLFNQLNSLYEEFSPLYSEMKKIVRFPDEKDAKDILDMKEDLKFLSSHYEDSKYLSQIIDVFQK